MWPALCMLPRDLSRGKSVPPIGSVLSFLTLPSFTSKLTLNDISSFPHREAVAMDLIPTQKVVSILQSHGIPVLIVGELVLNYYNCPRVIHGMAPDDDITKLPFPRLLPFVTGVGKRFYGAWKTCKLVPFMEAFTRSHSEDDTTRQQREMKRK
ncbi:hypothetical protein QBC46DRAFT_369086 [Diplogelasinospora grovesii]|uniref:Uncharacterized protein n=1 Tax=Diplogelasinospora grovesii TaxID=303347 RepID=A0AAN6SA71_9PEZI|nr:hypothetical protein QBC46DRAFT_369086 [Diplogelasinospora grovesii]